MKVFLICVGLLFPISSLASPNKDAGRQKYEAICASCHGKDGKKTNMNLTPKLAGQNKSYLEKQLKDFASGVRSNNPTMKAFAQMLSDEDNANISAYLSELK